MNGLYKIESYDKREDGTEVAVSLDPEHAIFQGHFPGRPVLPGVCSIQMIKECAERYLGRATQIAYMHTCKFVKSIDPRTDRHLNFKLSVAETAAKEWTLSAEGWASETCFIKLKARLKDL